MAPSGTRMWVGGAACACARVARCCRWLTPTSAVSLACSEARTERRVTETIKRTSLPFFVLQGKICALMAANDHVNVFLYDGAMVPDPEKIITSGHENKTARTVAIHQVEKINARALRARFKQILANNRAGGWRKLKARGR